MTTDVQVECVVCHRYYKITSFNPEMYSHPIIKNNFVCIICEKQVTKLKVVLSCTKCKKEFHTSTDWECPFCTKPVDIRDKRKKMLELDCDGCKENKGVCIQPDLSCVFSVKFVVFGGASELYSTKKSCTVLSISGVDMEREDIHSMKYIMLCNPKYSIAINNIILVKQRIGSKKNFNNKISLYRYEQKKKNFVLDCENDYYKGTDWIVPTRNRIHSIMKVS